MGIDDLKYTPQFVIKRSVIDPAIMQFSGIALAQHGKWPILVRQYVKAWNGDKE